MYTTAIILMFPGLMFLMAFVVSIPITLIEWLGEQSDRLVERRRIRRQIKRYRKQYAEASTDYCKGFYYGRAGVLEMKLHKKITACKTTDGKHIINTYTVIIADEREKVNIFGGNYNVN